MAQAPKNNASAAPAAQQQVQFQYIDRPDLPEIFADFISRVQFDGQTMRFEFCVSRVDDQPTGSTGKRYPACRLVLQPSAAIDLMNKMQQITASLIKAGVLKPQQQNAAAQTTVPENMA